MALVDLVHTARIDLIDFAELDQYFEVVPVDFDCLGFAAIGIFEARTAVKCLAVSDCLVEIVLAIESFDFVAAIGIGLPD